MLENYNKGIPEFNSVTQCCKCGTELHKKVSVPLKTSYDPNKNVVFRTCGCGYTWMERCFDNSQVMVNLKTNEDLFLVVKEIRIKTRETLKHVRHIMNAIDRQPYAYWSAEKVIFEITTPLYTVEDDLASLLETMDSV